MKTFFEPTTKAIVLIPESEFELHTIRYFLNDHLSIIPTANGNNLNLSTHIKANIFKLDWSSRKTRGFVPLPEIAIRHFGPTLQLEILSDNHQELFQQIVDQYNLSPCLCHVDRIPHSIAFVNPVDFPLKFRFQTKNEKTAKNFWRDFIPGFKFK